jgi:hypothetical protein
MQVLVAGRSSGEEGAAAAAAGGVQREQKEAAAGLDEEHVFLYKLVQGKVAASDGVSAHDKHMAQGALDLLAEMHKARVPCAWFAHFLHTVCVCCTYIVLLAWHSWSLLHL